jgi:transcriptional regulator with XRE-family HTH domain
MARRPKSFSQDNIVHTRKADGLNQSDFWMRFGVTQSGGSRYESGNNIPVATSMLIWLHQAGRISDKDLQDAMKAVRGRASS